MKSRGIRGATLGAILAASALALSGCVPSVCSAVGYLYDGPALVEFGSPLSGEATVSACFGQECEPADVPRPPDGSWVVPQESPYLDGSSVPGGHIRELRVVVTEPSGTVISDQVHEIPVSVERQGLLGQCPGPFEFEPVVVDLQN